MERSPFRAMAEAFAMSGLALAALLMLRAMGILAPVPVGVLVGVTIMALAISAIVTDSPRVRGCRSASASGSRRSAPRV